MAEPLGFSNRFRLAEGTIVPVEEAEEAEEDESLGELARRSPTCSWSSSSLKIGGGSGGSLERWTLANDL